MTQTKQPAPVFFLKNARDAIREIGHVQRGVKVPRIEKTLKQIIDQWADQQIARYNHENSLDAGKFAFGVILPLVGNHTCALFLARLRNEATKQFDSPEIKIFALPMSKAAMLSHSECTDMLIGKGPDSHTPGADQGPMKCEPLSFLATAVWEPEAGLTQENFEKWELKDCGPFATALLYEPWIRAYEAKPLSEHASSPEKHKARILLVPSLLRVAALCIENAFTFEHRFSEPKSSEALLCASQEINEYVRYIKGNHQFKTSADGSRPNTWESALFSTLDKLAPLRLASETSNLLKILCGPEQLPDWAVEYNVFPKAIMAIQCLEHDGKRFNKAKNTKGEALPYAVEPISQAYFIPTQAGRLPKCFSETHCEYLTNVYSRLEGGALTQAQTIQEMTGESNLEFEEWQVAGFSPEAIANLYQFEIELALRSICLVQKEIDAVNTLPF